MNFQLLVLIVNVLLLTFKAIGFYISRESQLLILAIDNISDLVFSGFVYLYTRNRNFIYIIIAISIVIVSQTLPVISLWFELNDVFSISTTLFGDILPITITFFQILVKGVLYLYGKDSEEMEMRSLTQDQIYDVYTGVIGLICNILMLTTFHKFDKLLDYSFTNITLFYTLIFWVGTYYILKQKSVDTRVFPDIV